MEPTASAPRRRGQPRDPNPFRPINREHHPDRMPSRELSLRLGAAEPQRIDPGVWDAHNAETSLGVGNVRYLDSPARNALASTAMYIKPELPAGPPGTNDDDEDEEEQTRLCIEPGHDRSNRRCSNPATKSSVCHNRSHTEREPDGRYVVCTSCDAASASALVSSTSGPLTTTSLLATRAYMCNPCAANAASSLAHCGALPTDSSSKVWGISASHTTSARLGPVLTSYPGVSLPATGCACASKLVDLRMCATHRRRAFRQMGEQTALMREWQTHASVRGLCLACLFRGGREGARESADVDRFQRTGGGPTGWLCLACNDWVVNQFNGPDGKPQLVPGRLKNVDVNYLFS